jgi:hypothetical protein
MIIRTKKTPRTLGLDEPIRHESHKTPVTRRDFIAQGMRTGPAIIAAPAALAMLIGSENARAMSPDLEAMLGPAACAIQAGAGKIPFIAFDLAGGANLVNSEILVGNGAPTNFLSTAGYAVLGLPGNMTPGSANPANTVSNNFVNTDFGAAWHSDGAILRGMQASTLQTTRDNVNGYGIAARSENDTGNNPHNPMYGINRVARGRNHDDHDGTQPRPRSLVMLMDRLSLESRDRSPAGACFRSTPLQTSPRSRRWRKPSSAGRGRRPSAP